MAQRGRKSAASLEVISSSGITTVRRPDPVSELSDEQAEVWRSVVNRLPADWFPAETHPLLAQYCRHVISARHVAELIAKLERQDGKLDIDEYDRLLKMQEREGRAISSLATRMRISQQSTLDREKIKSGKNLVEKPWGTV